MRCWLIIQGLRESLWQLWPLRCIARPMSELVAIYFTLRAQISFFPLLETAISMLSVPGILIVCVNHHIPPSYMNYYFRRGASFNREQANS